MSWQLVKKGPKGCVSHVCKESRDGDLARKTDKELKQEEFAGVPFITGA